MAELKDRVKEYYIPDNFIEEGRILQGRIKVRNLIEAAVLASIFAFPGLIAISNFPEMPLQLKVTVLVLLCAPPAVAGIVGFNGDRIFTVMKYARAWMDEKKPMLYNPRPRLLRTDPVGQLLNETRKIDAVIDMVETRNRERIERKSNLEIVEGRDFIFARDEHIDSFTGNAVGRSARTPVVGEEAAEAYSEEMELF